MKWSLARIGLLVLFCALLFLASGTMAQTGTSTIRGEISDAQGKLVAGATVTLKNTSVGFIRSQTTGGAGGYSFELIPPSDNTLEVEAKGFNKTVIDNVRALIGKPTETNVQLSVGAINQVVEVSASLQDAVINTQDASLGNVMETTQITQLPLEARNLVDLLSLQPGSTREGYVTGSRADQSNVTLDGVDINNAQTGNAEIPRNTNSLLIG